MRVLWFANIMNLILDPCFIFGLGPFPKLGVTGAAVATTTGRALGVLYQFAILFGGRSRIRLAWRDVRPDWKVMATLLRVSATGVAQFLIGHSSWIVLVRMISGFGSVAVAGYTIGIRIFVFVILPAWGLSGAAATMVGQNLGAGKPERAERAVWVTTLYNSILLGAVGAVFIAVPELLVRPFTADPATVAYAVNCLRIIAFGNITYGAGMVMVQAFNGAGDTVTPTVINAIGFWAIEIPLAWALAYTLDMKVRGVFLAIPLSESAITFMSLAMFWRGGWKRRRI
jgi:putative MATE family efflux protein